MHIEEALNQGQGHTVPIPQPRHGFRRFLDVFRMSAVSVAQSSSIPRAAYSGVPAARISPVDMAVEPRGVASRSIARV